MSKGRHAVPMGGNRLARTLLVQTAERAEGFRSRSGRAPCLAVVLLGTDTMVIRHAYVEKAHCDKSGLVAATRSASIDGHILRSDGCRGPPDKRFVAVGIFVQ